MGVLEPVDGTPFDFRNIMSIGGPRIEQVNDQIKYAKGYDHNRVLEQGSRAS